MTSGQIPGAINTFSVSATVATMIGTVTQGSLISNNSTDTAIYVGTSSVSPASGVRVGPLGSLTWQQTSNVWVIAEAASTTPVTVLVTDQVINPVSPLDVAAALANEGIPSKLITTFIGEYILNLESQPQWIDVSNYGTIAIISTSTPSGLGFYYNFAQSIVSVPYYQQAMGDSPMSFFVPVMGPYMSIGNDGAQTGGSGHAVIIVLGFNRQFGPNTIGNGVTLSPFPFNTAIIPPNDLTVQPMEATTMQGFCTINIRASYGDANMLPLSLVYANTINPTPTTSWFSLIDRIPFKWGGYKGTNYMTYNGIVAMPAASVMLGLRVEAPAPALTSDCYVDVTVSAGMGP